MRLPLFFVPLKIFILEVCIKRVYICYMKSTKKKKPSVRKNIDLPKETVAVFNQLATNERMKTKPFMEVVLIKYAENNKA